MAEEVSARAQAKRTEWFSAYDPVMDPEHARELLQAERTRLERALIVREHQDDGEEPDDQDPSNLAADLAQDELDAGLREDLEARLEAVERAEARLEAGTYGLSVASGEPIPDARLEVFPTAELTVEEERARGS
jgi:DnaK suppressor protein